MRKIGITLFTLLAVATSACAESPTASAPGAEAAALSGGSADWGSYEEETPGDEATAGALDGTLMTTTTEIARNPGLGLTGH
jgi:hypothetical protein